MLHNFSIMNDIYKEIILDLNRNPKNFKVLEDAKVVKGNNPLCGDAIDLYIKMNGNFIDDISFIGSGCAISVASASLLTELTKGLTIEQALALKEKFIDFIKGKAELSGKLNAFKGINPMRAKCATLAWHALEKGIKL